MDQVIEVEPTLLPLSHSLRLKRRHTKSRRGCVTCKLRRVKCDESLPRCRVCSTRGLQCKYAPLEQKQSQLPTEAPRGATISPWNSSAISTAPSHQASLKLPQSTTPDALLWQYYLAHASKTIAASSTDAGHARMWQESIPAIAFADPLASHAMMAFSAFCLSTAIRTKAQALKVRATAEHHYCQAVMLLRTSLPAIDRISADAVLACAMILIPCGLALAHSDESVFSLRDWMYHLRGWRTLGSSIYDSEGRGKPSDRLIPYPQQGIPDSHGPPDRPFGSIYLRASASPFMNEIQNSRRKAVADLRRAIEHSGIDLDSADIEAYSDAVTALEYVLNYVLEYSITNLFRAVFSWPIRIPPRYIELLSSHDELALGIYAHWLVLTMVVEDLWWLDGFGSKQIERLASQARCSKQPDSELLRWPMEMLNKWRRRSDQTGLLQ